MTPAQRTESLAATKNGGVHIFDQMFAIKISKITDDTLASSVTVFYLLLVCDRLHAIATLLDKMSMLKTLFFCSV